MFKLLWSQIRFLVIGPKTSAPEYQHRSVLLMSDRQKAWALCWAMWRRPSRAPCGCLVLVLCVHTKVLDCTLRLSCYMSIHIAQMPRWKVEGRVNGFIIRWWWRLEGQHDTQLVLLQPPKNITGIVTVKTWKTVTTAGSLFLFLKFHFPNHDRSPRHSGKATTVVVLSLTCEKHQWPMWHHKGLISRTLCLSIRRMQSGESGKSFRWTFVFSGQITNWMGT